MSSEGRQTTEELPLRSPNILQFPLKKGERLPTPLNDLGLVDPEALILLLKLTVEPEFRWHSDKRPDCHHLYWPANLYPNTPHASVNPAEFRELPSSKMIVPIDFHVDTHTKTTPPPIPEIEVMYEQIQVRRIAQELFKNARQAMRLERARWISDERLERGRHFHLERSRSLTEKARDIPKEFQPIDFDAFEPSTIEELQYAARQLGRIAVGANSFVRYIQLSAA